MRALRAFSAAAARLSFRQAAEDLFLTASAISHQVKQLETELGKPLFRRLPRSLELTAAGKRLAADLQPVLDQLDGVIEQHSQQAPPSEIRLTVRPLFANELLMPVLREFLETHPKLRIRVETIEDSDSFDLAYDASIRLFSEAPVDGEWDRLFPVSHIPVGTVALYDRISLVAGRVREPFPLIVHDQRPNAWRDWQKSSGLKFPRTCPIIELNSSLSVARAAEQGLGAALLPADLCESSIRSGNLVPLFDHALDSGEAFYFGCEGTLRTDRQFAEFHSWVLQKFVEDT